LPARAGALINLIDDEAGVGEETEGEGDDSGTVDNDDGEDTADEDSTKRKGKGALAVSHCDINFVKDTIYSLFHGETKQCWGKGPAVDPSPNVPCSRKGSCQPGDYLLMRGKDLVLKSTGSHNCTTTFLPEEELVLTAEWAQFDSEMTGEDLRDLDDVTFLIWWQNVKPPPVAKTKPPTVAKATASKAKGKGAPPTRSGRSGGSK
jgi:hypothetical protein